MLDQINAFENYIHWLMKWSLEGFDIFMETQYTTLKAIHLDSVQASTNTPEQFKIKHVDLHGVTRHTIQGISKL